MAKTGDKKVFGNTSNQQIYQVPRFVKRIKIEVYGASGGDYNDSFKGGLGGYAWGELNVEEGQALYVYVGGKPNYASMLGGYNGGGNGGNGEYGNGTGGGGATDVRINGASVENRFIVAGGGGGSTYTAIGGAGGGLNGSQGGGVYCGLGGKQTAGGTNGSGSGANATVKGAGGNASGDGIRYGGAGGGGGYYGGAGGINGEGSWVGGGGGGSSYYGGLQNAGTTAGVNDGHGKVVITILETDKMQMSAPSGFIGEKTNSENILTYSIFSELPSFTIVEKLNDVILNTKELTPNESTAISIDSEKWKSIAYGKFRDSLGRHNKITVESEGFVWEYTFQKSLKEDSSMSEVVKAITDSNEYHLKLVKKQLSEKVNRNTPANLLELVSMVNLKNLGGKNWARGVVSASSSFGTFEYAGAQTTIGNMYYATVNGLNFEPSVVVLTGEDGSSLRYLSVYVKGEDSYYPKVVKLNAFGGSSTSNAAYNLKADKGIAYVNETGFCLPVLRSQSFKWTAFE